MHLSPRERADFDEIVAQLRLEDSGVGTVAPRRHSMTLLVSVVVSLMAFLLGLALVVHRAEVLAPVAVASVALACALIAWKFFPRTR
jgi:hypothetical protein